MLIEQVKANDCYFLRESILRPGQPKKNWTFATDDDPRTIHLAMKNDNEVVAIVSLLPEKNEDVPNHPWRLRGMAVKHKLRGQGIGQRLLVALIEKTNDGVWCTARKNVQNFYLQNGFEIYGNEFVMNDMPHVNMKTI